MPPARIIFGCGYLGRPVAYRWRSAGDSVVAATRSSEHAANLSADGIDAILADVVDVATLRDLPAAQSMLYAVGFDRAGGHDILEVYAGGLRNVLAALPATVERAIYISTTGVYGSADGEWVDESTPPDPQRAGGRASLAAEQVLAAHPLGRRSVILRLAGLYGPGRVPHLDKLRAGEPLPVPADGWLNLIHVDDAARIVLAADAWLAAQPPVGAPHVFCVSDGCPVMRREYYAEVARVLGAAPPRLVDPPPDSPAAVRAGVSRRVSNRKMCDTLAVPLEHPTYREGLAAILPATL